MKQTKLLCLASGLLVALMAQAQAPSHPQYIKSFGEGESFASLYSQWAPGKNLSIASADDEEFFISRVRPRKRFVDVETQVDKGQSSNRKFLWWVPCGTGGWNALPSYFFNSEVFSAWSYIDHWGNWTAPYLRMPAAFADAAHKNGVSVSATAPIGFHAHVSPNDGAGRDFDAVITGGSDKYLQYLRYYGLDGAGYNSEFFFKPASFGSRFSDFLSEVGGKAQQMGFENYSNVWYSLTNNFGDTSSNWDSLNGANDNWFHKNGNLVSSHFFLNYNWTQRLLSTSIAQAEKHRRSSYDVYAGINMQKGSDVSWRLLAANPVSIGVWGAHRSNMLYEDKGQGGSRAKDQQAAYQQASEYLFTGGSNTPLIHHNMGSILPSNFKSGKTFFGISQLLAARSAMQGDLTNDPFVTYFNLGNGEFFNIEGKRRFSGEWYNLGMQDFLPTWRWWLSNDFMGRGRQQHPTNPLKARFIWDDAWFGGSCLELSGASGDEQYLQLFKTKYVLRQGDKITIRYKLVQGEGSVSLANAASGTAEEFSAEILSSDDDIERGEWIEKVITVSNSGRDALKMSGKTLAMIGLKFEETSADFKIRLGELSITRGSYDRPKTPTIVKGISLQNNYKGYDFKLIYKMADLKADKTITYNDEVKTWYYKIYTQQRGGAIEFCTATTSWAAYVVGAKYDASKSREVRYGVSAVSLDGRLESDIAWTDYTELKTATVLEDFSADLSVINPGDQVKIGFDDANQPAAKQWLITRAGQVVLKKEQVASFTTDQLVEVGAYDIECTYASGKKAKKVAMVTVFPKTSGAFPRIETLTADGKGDRNLEIKPSTAVKMAYTVKPSEGAVSNALYIQENTFQIPNLVNKLGIHLGNGKSADEEGGMTVSFWFRPSNTSTNISSDGIRILEIAEPIKSWPISEWGYFFLNYGSGFKGKDRDEVFKGFSWTNMTTSYTDIQDARGKAIDTRAEFPLSPGTWYHLALSIGYDLSTKLYINGEFFDERRPSNVRQNVFDNNFVLHISRFAKFGSALNAYVDELRVYNRVLDADEVASTMGHLEKPEAERGLKAYFDFEQPAQGGSVFTSRVGQGVIGQLMDLDWINENRRVWTPAKVVERAPGVGLIPGTAFPVKNTITWEAKKADQKNRQDKATQGSVELSWTKLGVYPVTLKVANAWGEDSKTFNVVTVTNNPTSIEAAQVMDLTVYPNPFVEDVRMRFAESGHYEVALYDLSGSLISRRELSAEAGQLHTLHVSAPAGVYLLRVMQAGRLLMTLKLQKH